ncbi:MAG: hydrogenase nickel incorporation protein HypB [Clostridiales bacterium]|nr:hydrogenase nickel incorporation protein HypB [Clostridiales bacterium]
MEIKIVKQILEWNEDVSSGIQDELRQKNVFLMNVMGSPGAGKTSLIRQLIAALRDRYSIAVIEGDIAGQIDADAIKALGIPVVQLQTDGACHIEALSIQHILPMFELDSIDLMIVENIGNLVCPAEFNIGEDLRVSILSVPEGDDKIEKYPLMFSTTDALVINKSDVRPYFDFDEVRAKRDQENANPHAPVFSVSCRTGEGVSDFIEWLADRIDGKLSAASGEGMRGSGSEEKNAAKATEGVKK